jgi:hypothetical protein
LRLGLGSVTLRLFALSLFPALILAPIVLLHSMAVIVEGPGRFLRLFIANSFPNLHTQRFVRPSIS